MKRKLAGIVIVISLISLSCSKIDTPQGLKQTILSNTNDINSALGKISMSKGYQVLSLNGIQAKSTEVYNDSITLNQIAGIYDYQPDSVQDFHHMIPYRLFKKTATSDMMIVNLPQRMIFHPRYLYDVNFNDSILENNFTISASDYHLYYTWLNSLDYKLSASLTLNSEDIGSFDIAAVSNSFRDQYYSSKYTFTEGYNISTEWQTGDTTVASFALLQGDNTLLKETSIFIGTDFHKREKQYILTIGNVEIKRSSGVDSIQVYLDGALQSKAGARITDSPDDQSGSICNKRDILLTFDDGTTAKLSELIGPALSNLKSLVSSLHDMYFAKNIVDYIALNIYYNSR